MSEQTLKRAVVRVWRGEPKPNNPEAKYLGSAFFIKDGYLLTARHVVANHSDLWLQGNAWDGRTTDQATLIAEHPKADLALLKSGKADGPPGIQLSREQVVLRAGEPLTLWGYGSEDGELECMPTTARGYLPGWGHECVHTNNAPGMSGGPAVREHRGQCWLIGLVPGRYPDANKTAILPLEDFREFIHSHLNPDTAPPLRVAPSEEFLARVRERISLQLQQCPVLHQALQAELENPGGAEECAEQLADPEDLENAGVMLHNAMDTALSDQNGAKPVAASALAILGWLLLLSVRPGWFEANREALNAGARIDFGLPLRTEAGVEITLAHLEQRPALLVTDDDYRKTFGRDRISSEDLLENGWVGEEITRGIKSELWKKLFFEEKHRFSEDDDKKLNNKIRLARRMRKGYYYLLTPTHNPNNPLHDKNICQCLLAELKDFKAVYYGMEGGASLLIEIEDELENLVNLFLQTVKPYT